MSTYEIYVQPSQFLAKWPWCGLMAKYHQYSVALTMLALVLLALVSYDFLEDGYLNSDDDVL